MFLGTALLLRTLHKEPSETEGSIHDNVSPGHHRDRSRALRLPASWAIPKRLRDVRRPDFQFAIQIGNRARYTQHAVKPTRRQRKPLTRSGEQLPR
jgi:hypothetical protein